jgi:hypothetical protein
VQINRFKNAECFLRLKHHLGYGVVCFTPEKLKPEEKVNLSIGMIDACVHICANAIKDRDETIKEEELLEKVRARITYKKRRHYEV